jgi:hypothetical protein
MIDRMRGYRIIQKLPIIVSFFDKLLNVEMASVRSTGSKPLMGAAMCKQFAQ